MKLTTVIGALALAFFIYCNGQPRIKRQPPEVQPDGRHQMACLQGMDTEKAFLNALGQASAWKISGQNLELFDSAGKAVARFEARDPA
jgi:heat shock protein HslJ